MSSDSDLATDISETTDLSAAEPAQVKQMQERLEALTRNVAKPLGGVNRGED